MAGILEGIRILDACTGLAGPYATRMLAEVGADVIRVEAPEGDPLRETAPAAFVTWNRSKRGIQVPGLRVEYLDNLLGHADVLVHQMNQREAAQAGLDDVTLAARFPHLIVASVAGFPPGHPDEALPAEEILVQARIGAMDEQQGFAPGPVFVRLPFASWGAAFLLAGGIAARLFQREKSGAVAPIHTSLAQGALVPASLYWQRAERPPAWMAAHTLPKVGSISTLTLFQCADGLWIQVLGGFAEVPPMLEFLAERHLTHLTDTLPITAATRDGWAEVFRQKTAAEWLMMLRCEDVPVTPVLDVGEILLEDQSIANGYAIEVVDPRFGLTLQAGPSFLSQPPSVVKGPAPDPGRDTDEVQREISAEPPRRAGAHPDLAAGRPLEGLRVLDLGMYVSSPFGAQCLADLGADVVKLEPPTGDKGRQINQFTSCQRGKRSIAIDLRRPEAAEVLRRLIAWADVVTHNMREDAARRLGIDELALRAINPKVIFTHVTAYGGLGPWGQLPGFDPNAQALSGWEMGIAGEGNPPQYLRNSLMDPFTGLAAFVGAALALYHREHSGKATRIDSSLLALAATLSSETLAKLPGRTIVPITPLGHDQRIVAPGHGVYASADGWVAVAATTGPRRAALRDALGVSGDGVIADAIAVRPGAAVVEMLAAAGVPATLVAMDNRDAFFDAELSRDTRLVVRTPSADWGWVDTPGAYWTMPGQPLRFERGIPALGEHTGELLRELRFSASEIECLTASGVVALSRARPLENAHA